MKIAIFVAAFYVVINLAVYGVIGLTFGLPQLGPPSDLSAAFDTPEGNAQASAGSPRVRRQEEITIFIESQAVGMLVDTAAFARAEKPQLIVVGASGAAEACRPRLLQQEFPDYQCSNLSMGGATASVQKQTVDELLRAIPAAILARSTLVLGMSYTLFMPDAVRWHNPAAAASPGAGPTRVPTCVDVARRRCPPILDASHPVARTLPPAIIAFAKQRFRVWRRVVGSLPAHPSDAILRLDAWRLRPPGTRTLPPNATGVGQSLSRFLRMTMEEQVAEIDRGMGPAGTGLDPDQTRALTDLIDRATAAGMQVLVVNLPLPSRHRQLAPRFEPSKQRLAEIVAPFEDVGSTALIDLSDAVGDEYFSDLAHPARQSLAVWTRVLADAIKPILRSQDRSTLD